MKTNVVDMLYNQLLDNIKSNPNGRMYLLDLSKHKTGKNKGKHKFIKLIGLKTK